MSVPCNLSSRPHGLAEVREGEKQDLVLYVNGEKVNTLPVSCSDRSNPGSPLRCDSLACTRVSLLCAQHVVGAGEIHPRMTVLEYLREKNIGL
eukprot:COSAG02_NODE_916_length_15971_cov_12.781061_2_plen_93_part_00